MLFFTSVEDQERLCFLRELFGNIVSDDSGPLFVAHQRFEHGNIVGPGPIRVFKTGSAGHHMGMDDTPPLPRVFLVDPVDQLPDVIVYQLGKPVSPLRSIGKPEHIATVEVRDEMGQDLGGTALAFVHDQIADAVPDFTPETHHLTGVTNGDELPRLVHALGKEAHFRAGNLKEILNLGQPAFEQIQFWNQHQGGLATLG